MLTGKLNRAEHEFSRTVLRTFDDDFICRRLLAAGAVGGVGAVEFGEFLHDLLRLPAGVGHRVEAGVLIRIFFAVLGRGRGFTFSWLLCVFAVGGSRSGSASLGSVAVFLFALLVTDEVFDPLLVFVRQALGLLLVCVLLFLLLFFLCSSGFGWADEGYAAEGQLCRGADQVAGLLVGVAGQVNNDVAVTLRGDLSFRHTRGVDALTDDLDGLFQLFLGDLLIFDLGFQDDRGAAFEVEGELRGPGRRGEHNSQGYKTSKQCGEDSQHCEAASRASFFI